MCAGRRGGETSRYYDDCKEKKPSALAEDAALAKALWAKSEAWVG